MKRIQLSGTLSTARLFSYIWPLLLSSLLFGCSETGASKVTGTEAASTVTVSAATSLKAACNDIKQLYQQEHPATKVIYNFGAAGSLQQQIEQGAPVDIFISASNKQMNALEKKGLIATDTRKKLLQNRLVLVTQKDNTKVKDFQDLTENSIQKIAIGEPKTVPAGQYALETLTSLGIVDIVKPKSVFAKDVLQVLNYVENGDVDAGFIYATDARKSNQLRVVKMVANRLHSPIVYPLAILKNSQGSKPVKNFSQFLSSQKANTIFQKYGFITN